MSRKTETLILSRPAVLVLTIALLALGMTLSSPVSTGRAQTSERQPSDEFKTFLPLIFKRYPPPPSSRFGTIEVRSSIESYAVNLLHAGWYLADPRLDPPRPSGMEPVFLVQLRDSKTDPSFLVQYLAPYVQANPGFLWLIGNEPDREIYQDGLLPSQYATLYHTAYHFLKQEDPTCQVAIGGIVQPTPLRLQYLDMILDSYQSQFGEKIPVDVWNIHNQILREKRGSWGAEIPPGISADEGRLYTIGDNDNIEIFKQHIIDFRQWMVVNGERDKPLILSEFGVLMPEEHGFDETRVKNFMNEAFDFLLTAKSNTLGYAEDDNHLVQKWAWYSLDDLMWDSETGEGFNGNLFNSDTLGITEFGAYFGAYTQAIDASGN